MFEGFGLYAHRDRPIGAYSKGMRQRIVLMAAILHNPEILILDEPFSGLDVTSASILRSLIATLAERGKAILFSSPVPAMWFLELYQELQQRPLPALVPERGWAYMAMGAAAALTAGAYFFAYRRRFRAHAESAAPRGGGAWG